jgi:hypothetical protein
LQIKYKLKSLIFKEVKKMANQTKLVKGKKIKKRKKSSKTAIKTKLKKSIPESHYFVFVSGQKIKNVKELADTLEMIDEQHYKHHANEYKNDFANWINNVFEEFDLAEKVKTAKDKNHARLIIYKHISNSFW